MCFQYAFIPSVFIKCSSFASWLVPPQQYNFCCNRFQVDHFGFDTQLTFQQRYLVANQFWNDDGGPIFFYTGNEGDITWFCNNTVRHILNHFFLSVHLILYPLLPVDSFLSFFFSFFYLILITSLVKDLT